MDFLDPSFLWGLPLIGVPVLIHLLNRRRHDVIPWGAMQFLLEAVTRRRRRWRLRDLLLLAMRVVAVAIILLAMAQPRAKSGWLGSSGPRDIVVVVDNSLSTAAGQTGREGTVFDAVRERAETIIGELNESDYVRVLLASQAPEWLNADPIRASGPTRRDLNVRVHELQPTLGTADMMQSLRQAIDAEPAETNAPRAVILVTDGQAYGWRADAAGSWRSLQRQASAANATLSIVTVGGAGMGDVNVSLDSLTAPRTVVGAGERIPVTAAIRNAGARPASAGVIKLLKGSEELGTAPVPALTAGQTTVVKFTTAFDKTGVFDLRAEITIADGLSLDNTAHLAVEVVDQIPILLVESAHDPEPLLSDTGYLAAALGQYAAEGAGVGHRGAFRPKTIAVAELTPAVLRGMKCVVLANVNVVPTPAVAALRDAVREGVGLWIVLGDRTEPAVLNDALGGPGGDVLPLPVAEAVGNPDDREQFERIPPPSAEHAATRLLADTQRLDINQVHVYRRHRLVPTTAPANAGENAATLLATDRGEPLAVERRVGRGRVIVQGLPLDARWSNLPACQAFVVMVHEWLWHLAEPGLTQWNLAAGETFNVLLPSRDTADVAEVKTPDGSLVKLNGIARQDERAFACAKTSAPGTYELTVADAHGVRRTLPFIVHRDPAESNLARLSEADRQMLVSAGDLHFGDQGKIMTATAAAVARPQPLWPWALLALLGLMLAELVLAGRLTRGRLDVLNVKC